MCLSQTGGPSSDIALECKQYQERLDVDANEEFITKVGSELGIVYKDWESMMRGDLP